MRRKILTCLALSAAFLCACGKVPSGNSVQQGEIEHSVSDSSNNAQVENRGADKNNWWNVLPRKDWAHYQRIPQQQDWFEVYKVLDGVYAIYEPGQFEEVISFLILGNERALLFDTGLGIGDIRAVVATLTDLDVVVLNSHTHYDHIGGNHQFSQILGRDTTFTRLHEAGSSHDDVAEFVGPGWVWKEFPPDFDPSTYRSKPFQIDERISDRNKIDLGGRILEVLETPGHTPDSICLIDRDNHLLFSGDTFYLAPLYTHLEGSDFEQYAHSAARLAALVVDIEYVLTAHNVPIVTSSYLLELREAFDTIKSGRGEYALADGHREYDFGDFSIIVANESSE
ncbi:MAG: MBL fold metallo-hydrolase [Gammaproteobacteria bacterium]|nr:MBL fold metallo-hydrolase [Gammaproteobacteria bacterium]